MSPTGTWRAPSRPTDSVTRAMDGSDSTRRKPSRLRATLLVVVALVVVGTMIFGLLALMGVFNPEHTLRVATIRKHELCGVVVHGGEKPRGQTCISPSPDFDTTDSIMRRLEPGDCVVYSTGEGGVRLERQVACPPEAGA